MERNLWVFFSFVFLSMASEHNISPVCARGAFISLLHHILSIFMLFGPFIFQEYKIHIVLSAFIWLGWRVAGERCIATSKYNDICKKGSGASFMNLQGILTEKTGVECTYITGIFSIIYCIYKLTFTGR